MGNDNNFVKDIKSKKAYKELNKCNIVTKDYELSGYPHLTFKISSVVEFLEIVELLSKTKQESFVNSEIIYRGMADKDWKLLPSLGRYENLDDGIEYNLVNSFLTLSPDAFMDLKSNFEVLSKMQHYGLPTRLLDFTSNPLIALFFSCDELIGKRDARVICHRAYVGIAKDPIIEEICEFYNCYNQSDLIIDNMKIGSKKYLQRLYHVDADRILVARPSYWNERIQHQSAIFMIFPNKLFDQYACWAYGGRYDYETHWKRHNNVLEMVEKEPLKEMYKYADQRKFEVTHETVVKLFDYYNNQGNGDLLAYWKEPFKSRFRFVSDLEPIDNESLKNEFCSIIIDKKYKKEILRQLKTLGIDKSYVYPELQYVAKKIKDLYLA